MPRTPAAAREPLLRPRAAKLFGEEAEIVEREVGVDALHRIADAADRRRRITGRSHHHRAERIGELEVRRVDGRDAAPIVAFLVRHVADDANYLHAWVGIVPVRSASATKPDTRADGVPFGQNRFAAVSLMMRRGPPSRSVFSNARPRNTGMPSTRK